MKVNKQQLNIELNRIINQLNLRTDKTVNTYIAKLIRLYKQSLFDVNNAIETIYTKYGDSVTLAQLYSNNRLLHLKKDIKEILNDLEVNSKDLINESLSKTLDVNSNTNIKKTIVNYFNTKVDFGGVNENNINYSILNDLSLVKWKDTNILNINKLNSNINDVITKGLIKGTGYKVTSTEIKNSFNVSARKSNCIVRTESHKVQNLARDKEYQELNNKLKKSELNFTVKRIWHASLDSRGRHGFMNGQETNDNDMFEFKGMEVSAPGLTGIAGEDINCRCTTSVKVVRNNN